MKKYLSLVKFSHTIFALPFAILGLAIALVQQNSFNYWSIAFVVLCMVFARNSAMGFNRFLDRDIDKKNPRTAVREVPSGKITSKNALLFVVVNSVLFVATTWFINSLVFYLSFVALFVVLGYSFTKRFTFLCHFVLGLGLGLAPLGSYLTVFPSFDLVPILLGLAVLTWVSGFDIIYALQDEEFDRDENLHSVPAKFGGVNAIRISRVLHILSAATIWFIGYYANSGILYFIGAFIYTVFLISQHLLVKPNDLSRINLAFFTMNGLASVVFSALAVCDFVL